MKRFIFSIVLCISVLVSIFGQLNLPFSETDALFMQAKEFFAEKKYAASMRYFEEFLTQKPAADEAQRLEANFYIAANSFYLQSDNAEDLLDAHITTYPNTPFADRVDFMRGVIAYSQRRYKNALDLFQSVDDKQLTDHEQVDLKLYKGYSLIETQNFEAARTTFLQIKKMNTRYNNAVTYYYAYSEYMLGNYNAALPDFQAIEEVPQYANIVPYYLTQIYYTKKDYVKVKQYADFLLKNNSGNQNNAEIYRILGEIAFEEKNYLSAISNLNNYEKIFPQVLRNDMYILGLSYYNTNDYKNAITYLSKVTTEKDSIAENAYLYLGNAYIRLGDKNNARMAYEVALTTHFNAAVREEAMFNYALTTYETTPGINSSERTKSTALFGESIKAFENFIQNFQNSKHIDEAYNYLSSIYLSTQDYTAALNSISKIQKPNAQILETKQYLYYRLGIIDFNQNKITTSIDNFTNAFTTTKIGKYAAEALFWRGNAYYKLEKYAESEYDFKQFFENAKSKTSENFVTANYNYAYNFFTQKKYAQAKEWFLKYINLEKSKKSNIYADALNRIGDCFFSERDFTKADNYYTQAAAANTSLADYAMFQSGYVMGLQKNYNGKIAKLNDLAQKFPDSEYAPQGMFEIGRAYIMKNDDNQAVTTYNNLIKKYPNSEMARRAALEIGMVYNNEGKINEAITAYKSVISKHAGSEEAFAALEALEAIYIDQNNTQAYLNYAASLGTMGKRTEQYADSISYLAAERQYVSGNFAQVIPSLKNYLQKYCPGGRDCITARYYLADSYYQTADKTAALAEFIELANTEATRFTEIAVMRCAEITYDQQDYVNSLKYFKKLLALAQTSENKNAARLGVLRCSFFTNDYQSTIFAANEILADNNSSENLKSEALYNRAKSYIATNQADKSVGDLKILVQNPQTESGAEANFLLANYYFGKKQFDLSDETIEKFIDKGTLYAYWLARAMVLLADTSVERKDDFQAKQYLLSLQRNYTTSDDVQPMIIERLAAIEKREKEKLAK
ncbi:MAG: tetratricopeptide repeat protein [Prevotellaceae bacterium]|jgi:TolA-binding protein|nr:tetratricopeptide repeat protein [Prevotellaceae bacterium]